MLKWLLLLVLAPSFGKVAAQNTIGLPLLKNYFKTDFKGGSQSWGIDQDEFGRMYFANNEGLIIYNGSYWSTYPLPNRTIARSVKTGSSGKIFVGGQGEAGFFTPDKKGGLHFNSIMQMVPKNSRDFADVWNIEILGDNVFFRTSDRILEFSNQTVQVFNAPNEWVYMQRQGNYLFAQDKVQGLFMWDNGTWKPVFNGNLSAGDPFHGCIALSDDSLILVSYHNGNYLFTNNTLQSFKQITPYISSEVVSVLPLNDKEFVMGTTGDGCLIFNLMGDLVQRITSTEGLQDNSILALQVDRDGNIWTALSRGISLIAYNSAIKFIKPSKLNELSGYSSRVYKNHLYVATNDGAYRISLENAPPDLAFCKGSFSQVPLSNGLAYRFDEINEQLLMAHNDGTFHIHNGKAEKLSVDASWVYLPISPVAPAQRILVGNYKGLKWLDFRASTFNATQNIRGLRESFRFLAMDNEQRIWASHPYRGIFQVQLSTDSLSYTTQLFTEKDGLPGTLDNHVFRIKNKLVFATPNGIYEFNNDKGLFEPSTFFLPIFGNMPVRYMKEDSIGNIWFVSGKILGYLAFKPEKKPGFAITYFPELTGQIFSGFENIYPYNQQNVFVASEKGIIMINLQKYLSQKEQKKVMFSSVHAIGKVDSIIHSGFVWSDSTNEDEKSTKISLPYNLNSLHFEYSTPAYGFQSNIEYSYILEGYEGEWSKWSSKPEKDYTNLPFGNYTFKVKAKSNLGIETEYAFFQFSIAPPWYKSGLAKFTYFLLFLLGVYLLNSYNRKKFERQKRTYEEKQEQLRVLHQLEIERNEKEIIRLQNEKLASEVLFKNRELADTTMHLVERSDAIQKVKESLQKLYKADSTNVELKKALHQLNEIEKNNEEWHRFAASFDEINNDFLTRLKQKFPNLTNNDLKLSAYLQLNMSSKEIAQLLNISTRGVEISRYRLRKKLDVPTEVNISDFLNGIVHGE